MIMRACNRHSIRPRRQVRIAVSDSRHLAVASLLLAIVVISSLPRTAEAASNSVTRALLQQTAGNATADAVQQRIYQVTPPAAARVKP